MAMGEPPAWTKARQQRLQQQYPQFEVVNPNMYIQSDLRASELQQSPLTDYTLNVLNLAKYAKRARNE